MKGGRRYFQVNIAIFAWTCLPYFHELGFLRKTFTRINFTTFCPRYVMFRLFPFSSAKHSVGLCRSCCVSLTQRWSLRSIAPSSTIIIKTSFLTLIECLDGNRNAIQGKCFGRVTSPGRSAQTLAIVGGQSPILERLQSIRIKSGRRATAILGAVLFGEHVDNLCKEQKKCLLTCAKLCEQRCQAWT